MPRSLVAFTAHAIAAPPMATPPPAPAPERRPGWLRTTAERLRREARLAPVWRHVATGSAR
jgi:hypothetical protein